jgi:hypothetical protein
MRKWWMGIGLLLGIACMWKACVLLMMAIHPDGEGIGVYFLGVEINDRVNLREIPFYVTAFFGLGMVLLFQVWEYWQKGIGLRRSSD